MIKLTALLPRPWMVMAVIVAHFGIPAQTQADAYPYLAEAEVAEDAAPDRQPVILSKHKSWFGAFSDIHFDPFYDPSLVDKLAAAEPARWDSIFSTSSITSPSPAGSDTNFPLFKSLLEAISKQARRLDYLIVPGDFLAHDFREKFQSLASDKSEVAYQRFVIKTMHYLARSLKARFPTVPVIAALGNNDSFCGDYMIQPAGDFLYETSPLMISLAGEGRGFDAYPELGAYVLPHPKTPNHYFVVFDDVFFSKNYRNRCGLSFIDPAQGLLLWLESTLYRMQRMGAEVTLVTHLPVGIDVYNSTKACSTGEAPTSHLATAHEAAFLRILKRYPTLIETIFVGHSHNDDFRVLAADDGRPFAFQRVVPSISPLHGNTPSYQVYQYDRSTGTPLNTITLAFDSGGGAGRSTWVREYDFKEAYGTDALTAESLHALVGKFTSDQTMRARYSYYFTGGTKTGAITDANWPAYACGLTNIDAAAFSACCRGRSP